MHRAADLEHRPCERTLTAQDDAEVAAEIAGRVVATPVERGTLVRAGAELIASQLPRLKRRPRRQSECRADQAPARPAGG